MQAKKNFLGVKMRKHDKLREKLHNYFENTGVQKKWFAEKMGMEVQQFYQILHGTRDCPKKYWRRIVELTNNKITLTDLAEDLLEYTFKDIEGIQVEINNENEGCYLSLKNINPVT